jgi:hypothetical protein
MGFVPEDGAMNILDWSVRLRTEAAFKIAPVEFPIFTAIPPSLLP